MSGSNFERGEGSYGKPTLLDYSQDTKCIIGKYCSIATDVVVLLGGEHRTDTVSSFPFKERNLAEGNPNGYSKGNVTIGNDVWIGHGVTILSGVTIGDGAVIGACSLVTRDVPPYAIYAGNPASLLRYRFSPAEIEALLEIKWWNWSLEKIEDNVLYLTSNNIEEFIRRFR